MGNIPIAVPMNPFWTPPCGLIILSLLRYGNGMDLKEAEYTCGNVFMGFAHK